MIFKPLLTLFRTIQLILLPILFSINNSFAYIFTQFLFENSFQQDILNSNYLMVSARYLSFLAKSGSSGYWTFSHSKHSKYSPKPFTRLNICELNSGLSKEITSHIRLPNSWCLSKSLNEFKTEIHFCFPLRDLWILIILITPIRWGYLIIKYIHVWNRFFNITEWRINGEQAGKLVLKFMILSTWSYWENTHWNVWLTNVLISQFFNVRNLRFNVLYTLLSWHQV